MIEKENIENLNLGAYVSSSTYRSKVIIFLSKNNFSTPTQIGLNTNIRVNHISKVLGELKSKGLIICINEDARKGRLYTLTELGEKVVGVMGDIGI